MKTIWIVEDRASIVERISKVTSQHRAMWGKMNVAQMLEHLERSIYMAMGELAVKSKKLPIRYPPLKQLIIYVAPFPKGAPTAPELVVSNPGEVAATRERLVVALDRLVEKSGALVDHPAFGRLSQRAWGRLVYRHFDHHLRQFGA